MMKVTILDRSELRILPTVQLKKTLQATQNEIKQAEVVLNSTAVVKWSDGGIERLYRRIKALGVYMKNISNEIEVRDDNAV